MTSYMTIMVRVVSNRAQAQLAALRAQQAGLTSSINASNRVEPLGRRHITSLMKFGNQLQWTGRMLQYNFTLPIIAAGAAATFFALEQEKAFIHVEKVYGDTTAAAAQFRKEMGLGQKAAMKLAESYEMEELEALDKAFTAISEHYGVQKKEVNEVAGAWAAAGASGLDLAESVNQTMQAIIIGDMNAMDATKALISIQAQYNLSTKELQATLANLNSVENQTGASMKDLIIGFEKAAGMARSAGIETQQLAAYMAALVPATGSASTAGNALKTIFSRLLSPTKEMGQVMEAMGLNIHDVGWQSASVSEQLDMMAKSFEGLTKKQQGAASSIIASRWQVNRFSILMKEIRSDTGYYAKALEASENQGESFIRMQKELNTVLESNPRKLQRMMVMLQNASVEIIQPLIPHIIYLAGQIAKLAQAFADLNPETQKLILFLVLLLAAVGPIVRYMGALVTLFGVLGHGVVILGHGFFKLVKILGLILVPFKMIGTVALGTLGLISSGAAAILGGLAKLFLVSLSGIVAAQVRFWALTVPIWRLGFATLVLQTKMFFLSFKAFWAVTAAMSATRWAAMWIVIKTITIAALGSNIKILWAFHWAIVRVWTATLLVTTNIWGRIAVAMVLFARNGVMGVIAVFKGLIPFLLKWGKWLVSPWSIAVLAIMGIIYAFRDQIATVWRNIVDYLGRESNGIGRVFAAMRDGILNAFYALPEGVQSAMVAVVTVVRDAALAVYEWFSYINPFARHSPSLVENVKNGMDSVIGDFARLSQVKDHVAAAYAEIKKFGNLTSNLGVNVQVQEQKEDRKTLKKAGAGDALASYNKLTKMAQQLNGVLKQLEVRITAQERVVDRWQKKLDEANDKLEEQQNKLDRLNDKLQEYQDAMSDAQSDLDYFANAPLVGMRAMEDQIFANTMAQTKLRLEMMNMEDAVGSFDDLKQKMESVNGLQEILRGTQTDLRSAGAGSEILGQYDAEIKKLEEQKGTYTETADKLNAMQVELSKLQREAEKLDLVKAMKFDELEYAIARAADQTKELTFDEIMSGIGGANAEIAKYGPLIEQATAAVEDQEKAVAEATATRDRYQERLDAETAKLDTLRDKYGEVEAAISAIETAINDVVSAAEKMNDALKAKEDAKKKKKAAKAGGEDPYISPGLQNFMDAGKAKDYADPGGKGIPPRTDWSSQADDINKFADDLATDTANMFADLNPFAPLKEKALAVWNWVKDKARDVAEKVKDFFTAAFDGVSVDTGAIEKMKDKLEGAIEFVTEFAKDILKPVEWAYELFWPLIKQFGEKAWEGLKDLWEKIGPKLMEFKDLWTPLGEAIANFWAIAKPIVGLFIAAFLLLSTGVIAAIAEAVQPAIEMITRILGGVIDLIKGVIKIIVGIFTADLGMILDGVGDIFTGVWDIIAGIVGGGIDVVWNLIQGFGFGIIDFFQWAWDKVDDKISKWWDNIEDAWSNIKDSVSDWWMDNVWNPIKKGVTDWWNERLAVWGGWWAAIKAVWNNISSNIKDWWGNNVWGAVSTGITNWWNERLAVWGGWWDAIKAVWNNISSNIKNWWLTNIWNPVRDGVAAWWAERLVVWGGWWNDLKTAWGNIKEGVGEWWEKNVTEPIFNKVTGVWTTIANWFNKNPNILKDAIKSVVNGAIAGVNKLIEGLNKVSDALPGLDFHITVIPEFAKGTDGLPTRRVGSGFKTNGARAIVGEGKANHPEFVIPTDPTYRNRARTLLAAAADKLGMTSSGVANRTGGEAGDAAKIAANGSARSNWMGTPMYASGGILGAIKNTIGDLAGAGTDWVVNKGRDMVSFLANPFLNGARNMVNKIDWSFLRGVGNSGLDAVERWIKGGDKAYNDGYDAATGGPAIREALEWARAQVGKPYKWGGVGPDGYDCSGFMSAITNHIRGQSPYSRVGATGSFPWSGFAPGAAVGKGFTIGSSPNYGGSGIGHMAGTLGGVSVESAGGVGVRVGGSARGYTDPGFSQVAHLAMKQGGIALARRGKPTPITVGDGRYDEAVVPLPHGWQNLRTNGGKEVHVHVNGDLSFPNITDPNDAELFIKNLENLAED